jgi:cell division protein FtsL
MKKTSAILLFFCCNALLIFLQVHKQGQYLKLSYELQKLQSQITLLNKQHSDLIYALQAQQQPHSIQDIAEKQMAMQPIELTKIKFTPKQETN